MFASSLGVSQKLSIGTKYSRGRKHNYVSGVQSSGQDVGLSIEEADDNLDGVANLYEIKSRPSLKLSNINSLRVDPFKLQVNIEGQNTVMELDTWASVSVCCKNFYQNNVKTLKLLQYNPG